jgi:hypothetical protein
VKVQLVMLNGTPPSGSEMEELDRCGRSLEETVKSQLKRNAQLRTGAQQQQEIQPEITSRLRS